MLHGAVRQGFAAIDAAVDAIRTRGRRGHLTVVTDFGFAAFWLIPRLESLKAAIGGKDVHIVTTQSSMNTSVAFAALIWISVVGLLLYGIVVLLAHLWAPWAEGID